MEIGISRGVEGGEWGVQMKNLPWGSWIFSGITQFKNSLRVHNYQVSGLKCMVTLKAFLDSYHSYEVTSTKYSRDIYKELLVSLVASLFMGFGVLFLLLWVGIYV